MAVLNTSVAVGDDVTGQPVPGTTHPVLSVLVPNKGLIPGVVITDELGNIVNFSIAPAPATITLTQSTVPITAVSSTVIAVNTNKRGYIYNPPSNSVVYLQYDAVASTSSFDVQPGTPFLLGVGQAPFTNEVRMISPGGNQNVLMVLA